LLSSLIWLVSCDLSLSLSLSLTLLFYCLEKTKRREAKHIIIFLRNNYIKIVFFIFLCIYFIYLFIYCYKIVVINDTFFFLLFFSFFFPSSFSSFSALVSPSPTIAGQSRPLGIPTSTGATPSSSFGMS